MSEPATPRLQILTIRGIACVALVAYHVVGPTSANGMHLPASSGWHYAMASLDFLRMPLFTVLSGFLYAGHRADRATVSTFMRKKAVRLVAPLVFATLVTFLLRRLVYGAGTTLVHALFFSYEHLWFLQAIVLIFLLVALWDTLARPNWAGLCVAGFAAVMVSRSFYVTSFLSSDGALYLLPFFLFGMVLRLEAAILRSREAFVMASWIVGIVILSQQAINLTDGNPIFRTSVPAALCGCGAAYLMVARLPRIAVFERIGTYSYTIYIWHSIAAAAVRRGLESIVHLPTAEAFTVLLAAGVAIPIAIHVVVRKIPVISVLAAGIHPGKERRSSSVQLFDHAEHSGPVEATS
jgi:peptidoglycan/LPS O-acetylase OafA/YrhL